MTDHDAIAQQLSDHGVHIVATTGNKQPSTIDTVLIERVRQANVLGAWH